MLGIHGDEGVGDDEVGGEAGLEEDAVKLEGEVEVVGGGGGGFYERREEGDGATEAMGVQLTVEQKGLAIERAIG